MTSRNLLVRSAMVLALCSVGLLRPSKAQAAARFACIFCVTDDECDDLAFGICDHVGCSGGTAACGGGGICGGGQVAVNCDYRAT